MVSITSSLFLLAVSVRVKVVEGSAGRNLGRPGGLAAWMSKFNNNNVAGGQYCVHANMWHTAMDTGWIMAQIDVVGRGHDTAFGLLIDSVRS